MDPAPATPIPEDIYPYITYIKPSSDGRISPKAVEAAIQEDTGLVSVMFTNNETGVTNDINEIGRTCRQNEVLLHRLRSGGRTVSTVSL